MMRNVLSSLVALILFALIQGCGGGGGGGNDSVPTVDQNSTAEGMYDGSTNTGRSLTGIVLDNGVYYILYSDVGSNYIAGAVQGTSTSSDGVLISNNARDFNLEGLGVSSATVSANYVTEESINGSVYYEGGSVVSFSGTYNPDYQIIPSLADVAGTYSGEVVFSLGFENATLTVSPTGALSGAGTSGCGFTGSVAPRASGNVYNVSINFGGAPCFFANETLSGIAYYESSGETIVSMAPNASRTDGVLFVGSKASFGTDGGVTR